MRVPCPSAPSRCWLLLLGQPVLWEPQGCAGVRRRSRAGCGVFHFTPPWEGARGRAGSQLTHPAAAVSLRGALSAVVYFCFFSFFLPSLRGQTPATGFSSCGPGTLTARCGSCSGVDLAGAAPTLAAPRALCICHRHQQQLFTPAHFNVQLNLMINKGRGRAC